SSRQRACDEAGGIAIDQSRGGEGERRHRRAIGLGRVIRRYGQRGGADREGGAGVVDGVVWAGGEGSPGGRVGADVAPGGGGGGLRPGEDGCVVAVDQAGEGICKRRKRGAVGLALVISRDRDGRGSHGEVAIHIRNGIVRRGGAGRCDGIGA